MDAYGECMKSRYIITILFINIRYFYKFCVFYFLFISFYFYKKKYIISHKSDNFLAFHYKKKLLERRVKNEKKKDLTQKCFREKISAPRICIYILSFFLKKKCNIVSLVSVTVSVP